MATKFVLEPRITVVCLGHFNPKIFHPLWFVDTELIGKSEGEEANIELNNNDVSIFTAGWLRVEVLRDRSKFQTQREDTFQALKDLCQGVFSLLPHTPIRAVGLNWDCIIKNMSIDERHQLGDYLVPKDSWSQILKGRPLLRSVDIESERYDDENGVTRVSVSAPYSPKDKLDVEVRVNSHLNLMSEDGRLSNFSDVNTNFDTIWSTFVETSPKIIDNMLSNAFK